ncbi:MAG: hypothetical protein ACI91Z_001693, partial [Yoonia sp.]
MYFLHKFRVSFAYAEFDRYTAPMSQLILLNKPFGVLSQFT